MLPQQLRVYAYSQRGHGVSDRPDSGYSFKDLSNDLAQFMDAMGVQSAVLVGHSMSSGVVRQFALDYPERVRGLVLEAGFATWKGSPVLEAFWNETISKLEDPIDRSFAEEFQRSTLKRPVPPEFFNMVVGESLRLPARVWKDIFRNFMEVDFSADTRTITAPTIIVWGDQDTFADLAEQQKLQAAIPGSRLITYAGTGHGMHWEEPEKFARDLINFARSVK
jgi:non-heme chloroperoxidase